MVAVWVWPVGTASYLILAGSTDLDEVLVAVLLGGLGAAWHAAVLKCGARRFAFERPAFGEIGRSLAGLPRSVLEVGARLASAIVGGAAGRQVEVPFAVGREGVPVEAGRRALVVLAASLSPDSYVLRLSADEERMRCHALTRRTPGGDRRWPA